MLIIFAQMYYKTKYVKLKIDKVKARKYSYKLNRNRASFLEELSSST